ncbi:hypothetical protein Hte_010645 [Hypoxylon texense]
MSSSTEAPTIVMVQGSFQLPDVYCNPDDALRALGYPVVHPPLPSLTGADKPDFATKSLTLKSEVQRQSAGLPGGVGTRLTSSTMTYPTPRRKRGNRRSSTSPTQSYAVQRTKMTNEAFGFIKSTYVVCENGRGPPPMYQEDLGGTAGSKILKISSGHSPMLSHTAELARMIGQAVKLAVETGA